MNNITKERLLAESSKTKGHITITHKEEDAYVVLLFNSFLYEDIKEYPFYLYELNKEVVINIDSILATTTDNILKSMDSFNESIPTYDAKDKEIITREIAGVIKDFFSRLS